VKIDLEFDRHRLKQAILYIAHKTKNAESFGAIKMNKVLYRTQCAAVREGRSFTSFTFQKNKMGPTLRAYVPLTNEMESEGLVEIRKLPVGRKNESRVWPIEPVDLTCFTARDVEIFDEEIARVWKLTAHQVSDEEHLTAAWYSTFLGETIKDGLALVEDLDVIIPLNEDEKRRAQAAIERFRARTGTASDPRSRSRVH
jgi:hypothetical protein